MIDKVILPIIKDVESNVTAYDICGVVDQKVIDLIRQVTPEMIAKEINSVQPFDQPEIKKFWDKVLSQPQISEKELREQGYSPVCEITKLMWVKR